MTSEQRAAIELTAQGTFWLRARPPFHFEGTVFKPSRFPARFSRFEDHTYRQTLRWGERVLGVRLEDAGTARRPGMDVELYAQRPLPDGVLHEVQRELQWRFDLGADLRPLAACAAEDDVLGPVWARWAGMRGGSPYSLYEFLVTAILLQNASVRRTVTMSDALFLTYGSTVAFDGVELSAFWSPTDLLSVPESDLRALKLGYRAKSLRRVSEAIAAGSVDEHRLRLLPPAGAKQELLGVYGIGPASVAPIAFNVLHDYGAFDVVPPWEQKIFSRLLFEEDIVPPERILAEVGRRWGAWRMLAVHYLFEDLFWRHRREPIDWLDRLILL